MLNSSSDSKGLDTWITDSGARKWLLFKYLCHSSLFNFSFSSYYIRVCHYHATYSTFSLLISGQAALHSFSVAL